MFDFPDNAIEWLHQVTGIGELTLTRLAWTLAVLFVLWLVRALTLGVVNRRTADVRVQYQWRKGLVYAVAVLGVLLIGRIWIDEFRDVATFLGLVSAGLAIALRDLVVNLAGWLFIVWKRPFQAGDRIEVNMRAGDVIDVRLFQFTLLEIGTQTGALQSTGRIIHVPNGVVFTQPVVNFSRGFQYVWHEIPIPVTFESNWRKAKDILLQIAHDQAEHLSEDAELRLRRAAQEYMIFYSKLTPTVYTRVIEYGVELTIRYLVEPRRIRGSEQSIWEAVLDEFARHDDVAYAYPTRRVFNNVYEGKPGARADIEGMPMQAGRSAPGNQDGGK